MQTENKPLVIMLATYNGEKYVQEQLDSIVANNYPALKLIISDDGSDDRTPDILKNYAEKYPYISVINHSTAPHGAFHNFACLVRYVKEQNIQADYYMFSDQDDVWKSDKIEKSLSEIQKYDSEIPTLVYTSKQYVDENLKPMDVSLKREADFDINILHQNKTYGCTYIFNKFLLDKLSEDAPLFFINYDHYVALQAFLYGKVAYLPYKTIFYRQHGDNVSGIVNKKFSDRLSFRKKYTDNIIMYKKLISYAYEKRDCLDTKNSLAIEKLNDSKNSRLHLAFASMAMNIKKNTLLGTVQFYLALLLLKGNR